MVMISASSTPTFASTLKPTTNDYLEQNNLSNTVNLLAQSGSGTDLFATDDTTSAAYQLGGTLLQLSSLNGLSVGEYSKLQSLSSDYATYSPTSLLQASNTAQSTSAVADFNPVDPFANDATTASDSTTDATPEFNPANPFAGDSQDTIQYVDPLNPFGAAAATSLPQDLAATYNASSPTQTPVTGSNLSTSV